MEIRSHQFDLPAGCELGEALAVDTETLGLNLHRDRLCVVQLTDGSGVTHVVHFPEPRYEAPRLRAALGDRERTKIFHFARFDVAVLERDLRVRCAPVFCTKIASKLCRTYTDRHGLKDLCREMLGVDLSKQQQSSDWGAPRLTQAQLAYAASDVAHLHALKSGLETMLAREGRAEIAARCFEFLPHVAALDLAGFEDVDLFAH